MADEDAGAIAPTTVEVRRRSQRVTWTTALKGAFLDHLAATCNVTDSARSIGVDKSAVYALRRKDRHFRAAWLQAIESGYEMLETQLIGHALSGGGAAAMTNGDVARTGPIDVQLAQTLLAIHRHGRAGSGKVPPTFKAVTPEQTDASILRKLKAMQRTRKRPA